MREATERLAGATVRAVEGAVETILRPTARTLNRGVEEALTTDRDGANPVRAAGRDVSESASPVPAPASVLFDRPVAAAERRVHTKQDYIESFEDRIGRKLTQAEVKTVDLGCIGLTMVRLGRTGIEVPPTNLAFADARAHRLVAETEKVLGPGEIANDAVNRLRRDLTRARQDLETELKKPGAGQDSFTVPRLQAKIKELEDEYEQAKTTTRQYWARIGAEQVTALLEARDAAKAVGGQQVSSRYPSTPRNSTTSSPPGLQTPRNSPSWYARTNTSPRCAGSPTRYPPVICRTCAHTYSPNTSGRARKRSWAWTENQPQPSSGTRWGPRRCFRIRTGSPPTPTPGRSTCPRTSSRVSPGS